MIRIDWVQLCEIAFFDDCDRLCMIGVMNRFPAPALPIAMRQLMIVVRIAHAASGESFAIGVSFVTPRGVAMTPKNSESFEIAVSAEYIFITLRELPLAEEGVHRFGVSVGDGDPVFIDVPVRLASRNPRAHPAPRDRSPRASEQPSWIPRQDIN